jgi:predicted DNA-binding transcriptional regulator AlpA
VHFLATGNDCEKAMSNVIDDDDVDFVDVKTACAILGGSKPWHPSTLWRALRDPSRNIPRPVHTGPNQIRFIRKELIAAKAAMVAARDNPVAQDRLAQSKDQRRTSEGSRKAGCSQ